jgi:DNA-binding transcriptional regulator PaaX
MKYLKYKGMTVNMFGIPSSPPKDKPEKSVKRDYSRYQCFSFNYPLNAPKNLIVVYDIPDNKRKERDWFRRHLQKFEYLMVQKSVWVGPSPLPKDFLYYVKSIGLSNKFKTFKLAESYSKGNINI